MIWQLLVVCVLVSFASWLQQQCPILAHLLGLTKVLILCQDSFCSHNIKHCFTLFQSTGSNNNYIKFCQGDADDDEEEEEGTAEEIQSGPEAVVMFTRCVFQKCNTSNLHIYSCKATIGQGRPQALHSLSRERALASQGWMFIRPLLPAQQVLQFMIVVMFNSSFIQKEF
jgi:hypothetical protein